MHMPIEHNASVLHPIPLNHRVVAKYHLEPVDVDLSVVTDILDYVLEQLRFVSEVVVVVATDEVDLPVESGQNGMCHLPVFVEAEVTKAVDRMIRFDDGIPSIDHIFGQFFHVRTISGRRAVLQNAFVMEVIVTGEPDATAEFLFLCHF